MVEAPPILKKKKPIFLMVLCSLVGIFAICALVFVLSYQTPEGQVREQAREQRTQEVEPLTLPDVLQKILPSVVIVEAGNGHGSGFVIGPDLICTNHHVIDGAGSVKVVFKNGATRKAQGTRFKSESMDIAILKVAIPTGIPVLELHPRDPRQGEKVYAIGAPLGYEETVTDGIVSKVHSEKSAQKNLGLSGTWIQTNAEMNSGNSGGPLINSLGEVVGMSTLSSGAFQDKQGKIEVITNINFATSALNIAKAIRLAESGELSELEPHPKRKPGGNRPDIHVTYHKNGQKKSEGHYKNGKKEGLWTYWSNYGKKKTEAHFKNGKREGPVTHWHYGGQKKSEYQLKNGRREGLSTTWHANGQKWEEGHWKNKKREGLWTWWYSSGQKWKEYHYKNGKEDGLWTQWDRNGKKVRERDFKNGEKQWESHNKNDKLVSASGWKPDGKPSPLTKIVDGSGILVTWHENGQKASEAPCKNGELDGLWTEWDRNGKKEKEIQYKNGVPDGLWTEWYDNGQKKQEGHSKDGKADGVATWWHKNGKKRMETHWKDGKLDGLWTEWDGNGKKEKEIQYKNGHRVD